MPVVVGFLTALTGMILALWLNIRIVRNRLSKWTGDLAVLFIFSVGSIDKRKRELWTERGFSEDEANMIIKQQLACLFEMPIGFVAGAILSAFLSR